MAKRTKLDIVPATKDCWADLEKLFGSRGACDGCWCQYFKRPRAEYEAGRYDENRKELKRSVDAGEEPGLLAYQDGRAIGWCAVEPRERYRRFEKSRTIKPVDDRPAWAVPCFFVARDARGQGVSVALLEAAAKHAKARGAEVIEGYPAVPRKGRIPDTFAYIGTLEQFERCGFEVAAEPSEARRIMRKELSRARPRKA